MKDYIRFMKSTSALRWNFLFALVLIILLCDIFVRMRNFPSTEEPRRNESKNKKIIEEVHHGLPTRKNWSFRKTPKVCKKIVQNPKMYTACKGDPKTGSCEDGTWEMFSQYGQDFYLYTRHFSKLNRRGVYIDLAAHHPFVISNTYFMDECLGWDGICIEAHPDYIPDLRRHRSCKLVPKCVSDKEGDRVKFILDGGGSGISSTNKFVESWQQNGIKKDEIELNCTTLIKIFRDTRVSTIDYMSLDVEGHELNILKSIDWNKITINILSIETSPKTEHEIENYMVENGYTRHVPNMDIESRKSKLLKEDLILVRDGVIFGAPV